MTGTKGPLKILFSNTVLCLSLVLIGSLSKNSATGLIAFSISFLIVAVAVLASCRKSFSDILSSESKPLLHLLGWSCSVTFVYFLFIYFKDSIQLSHIIIAKSITPLIAVYLSGDFKEEKNSWGKIAIVIATLSLLFGIAYFQWVQVSRISLKNWGVFSLLIIGYSVSQTLVRVVAKSFKPIHAASGSAFLNSILYFLLMFSLFSYEEIQWSTQMLWGTPLMALCIVLASYFTLDGIKETPPYLSTLCLSSTVPISLIVQGLFQETSIHIMSAIFSAVYFSIVAVQSKYLSRERDFKCRVESVPNYGK